MMNEDSEFNEIFLRRINGVSDNEEDADLLGEKISRNSENKLQLLSSYPYKCNTAIQYEI